MFWRGLAILAALTWSGAAWATDCPTTQSTPAFTAGGSVFGRIAAQWNQYFAQKADANNGILCNPTIVGGSTPGAFTIGSGFTNTQGTRNQGNNTISSGANFFGQFFPVSKTVSYIVNSQFGTTSDSRTMLIANGSGISFTLPQPAAGTIGVTYQFGSNGTNGYTLTTAGLTALFYGCSGPAAGATSYAFAANIDVQVIDTGTAYKCTLQGTGLAGISQLTGDVTAGPGSGSQVATLAASGVSAAAYVAPSVTFDAKGRATTAASTTCNNSPFIAFTNCAQTWTASQRGTVATVTISTATFTPNFDTAQNFTLTLSSACPCTIANPSTTPVAGQSGMIEIVQDGTGSRTVGTWGSQWIAAGGVSVITLSTAANAKDRIPYYVPDSTHVMLGAPILNATH